MEYFVGAYKKADKNGEPFRYDGDNVLYDDFIITKDEDEATAFAHSYNEKGYYTLVDYSDGKPDAERDVDYYVYEPYTMKDLFSALDESAAAVASAPLMNLKNQLMNKLGAAFTVIGGGMIPKVTVYADEEPDDQFEITTDGRNVDVLPKHDGIPDTANKKRGIAFMRAANVICDFIKRTLGIDENLKLEIKEEDDSMITITEKSNFDSITKAADYYYPRWKSEVMDSDQIRDELTRLGHNEDFVDGVLELIFDMYDDDQRYWDEYDESVESDSEQEQLLTIREDVEEDEDFTIVAYYKGDKVFEGNILKDMNDELAFIDTMKDIMRKDSDFKDSTIDFLNSLGDTVIADDEVDDIDTIAGVFEQELEYEINDDPDFFYVDTINNFECFLKKNEAE